MTVIFNGAIKVYRYIQCQEWYGSRINLPGILECITLMNPMTTQSVRKIHPKLFEQSLCVSIWAVKDIVAMLL